MALIVPGAVPVASGPFMFPGVLEPPETTSRGPPIMPPRGSLIFAIKLVVSLIVQLLLLQPSSYRASCSC